jgi:hypothetical protein
MIEIVPVLRQFCLFTGGIIRQKVESRHAVVGLPIVIAGG